MLFRLPLAALALTTVATTSEAGPRRYSQPVYQPVYRSPVYQSPTFQPAFQPVYQPAPVMPSTIVPAGGVVTTSAPVVLPAGGVVTTSSPVVTPGVEYVSNYTPVAATVATADTAGTVIVSSGGMAGDGLDEVNAKRSARGLRPFLRDEGLMQAARSCAAFRANAGLFGHTSNDFSFVPAGTSASSAGCAAYPAGFGWMSCCTYDNYTYAGAAYATGRDGKRYMHLFVR